MYLFFLLFNDVAQQKGFDYRGFSACNVFFRA